MKTRSLLLGYIHTVHSTGITFKDVEMITLHSVAGSRFILIRLFSLDYTSSPCL